MENFYKVDNKQFRDMSEICPNLNKNYTGAMSKFCSQLIINTPEQCQKFI